MRRKALIHSEHAKTLTPVRCDASFLARKYFCRLRMMAPLLHIDRVLPVGGIMPVSHSVEIGGEVGKQAARYRDRRELGVINIGGAGAIIADGSADIGRCLHIGRAKELVSSAMRRADRRSFITTAPAHAGSTARRLPTLRRHQAITSPVTVAPSINTSYRCTGNLSAQYGTHQLAPGNLCNMLPYP